MGGWVDLERGGGGGVGVLCGISQAGRWVLTQVLLEMVIYSMVKVVDLRKFLVKGMVEVDRSRVPAVVDVAAACLAAEQLQKMRQNGVNHYI